MSLAFWKKHPKKFLGIDIGSSSIKIVEIGKEEEKKKLENYGEVEESVFGEIVSAFKNGKENKSLSNQYTAELIREILDEAEIGTKDVNFSIPDFLTFFTSFEMPVMEKEEIPEAIRYEVRPYIPLPLSEVTLDWTLSKGRSVKNPFKVLVAAIPNKIISQYQEIAGFAGLELRALEPEVFSLARASIKDFIFSLSPPRSKLLRIGKKNKFGSESDDKKKEEKKEVIGLIDIGSRSTTCSVVDEGVLEASHSFNIAGEEFRKRLAKSLNISYNESKKLVEEYGLSFSRSEAIEGISPDEAERKSIVQEVGEFLNSDNKTAASGISRENINNILFPLADVLLDNIKTVFRDFYREEGKEVDRIILAGGLALLPGLKEYFSNKLKKEIVISNPFENISYPSVLGGILEKKGPSYAVCLGLAMKGLE